MGSENTFLQDLDDPYVCDELFARIEKSNVHNFAVQYDASEAQGAVDLSSANVQTLLDERDASKSLWLNLWGWGFDHGQIIMQIAKHYDVSPRLAHVLCPGVGQSAKPPPKASPQTNNLQKSAFDQAVCLEEADSSHSSQVLELTDTQEPAATEFANIINALWHFCTVDFGPRYVCIGWNALFFLPDTSIPCNQSQPTAHRIWSSLLLCNDGTLVSIFESPPDMVCDTRAIRRNQVNVFRNISRCFRGQSSALMQVLVRPQPSASPSSQAGFEIASLLFYYLFDDWLNLFGQVSGGKHSYRHRLEQLRNELTVNPSPEQVNTLHHIGRQLSVLRSICRSYESIIERILHKQLIQAKMRKGRLTRQQSDTVDLQLYDTDELDSMIRLSASSVARFERLLDRIGLCALTEVDECLKEKEALVLMNFNLVSLKQAHSVERLTRITILLAKVTILFLPISLATGYFSMQLKSIESYSVETYWLTFLVVSVLTMTFLATFEFFASRYSGNITYKSLTRTFFERRKKQN